MVDEIKSSSLVDQIAAKTIEALTDDSEFDDQVLARLRKLVDSNDLTDADKVADALRVAAEY